VLRGIIQHHPGGPGEGLAKGIERGDDLLNIYAAFKDKGKHRDLGREKAENVDRLFFSDRHFDLFTHGHGLPGIGHTGGERETAGIEKIQVNVPLGALGPEDFSNYSAS
jgi:hypothetical protein